MRSPFFTPQGFFMFDRTHGIAQADPELWNAIRLENRRQESHIELIASENYASPAGMAPQGSPPTNTYPDGRPRETVHWSTGAVFWLDLHKYSLGRVVYDEVPGPERGGAG
jgi:hypothetical protein